MQMKGRGEGRRGEERREGEGQLPPPYHIFTIYIHIFLSPPLPIHHHYLYPYLFIISPSSQDVDSIPQMTLLNLVISFSHVLCDRKYEAKVEPVIM